jgi:UDP-glucose 4-epimerase
LALNDKTENEILNLEGMRRISIKEIAETIDALYDKDLTIEYMDARPGDYEGKEASNDKIKRLLDWEPKIDFKEGMEYTLEWFKSIYSLK